MFTECNVDCNSIANDVVKCGYVISTAKCHENFFTLSS